MEKFVVATRVVRIHGSELELMYFSLLLLVSLAAIYLGKWNAKRLISFALTVAVLLVVAAAIRDALNAVSFEVPVVQPCEPVVQEYEV